MIVLFLNLSTSDNKTREVPQPPDSTAAVPVESLPPTAAAAAAAASSTNTATQQSMDVCQEQVLESELFKES